jgi:RNA polymerase sigma-70 factor (ECF subfamily)
MLALHGTREEDDGLVARARRGDSAAFESLYRRHVDRVHALCLRMSGDAATAGELTRDTFVRAWSGLTGLRGDAGFGTWIHRIAVNEILLRRRGEGRRALREVVSGPTAEAPESGARLDLERAIAALPEGARLAFLLHDVHGYTHREIAEMTGTVEGTAKAQLHRARQLLRKALEP